MALIPRMGCLSSLLCSILMLSSWSGSAATTITQTAAETTVYKARNMLTYTQEMPMRYLLVANGIDIANGNSENEEAMRGSMKHFSTALTELEEGTAQDITQDILSPPVTIQTIIARMKTTWEDLKPMLLNVSNADVGQYVEVSTLSDTLMRDTISMLDGYVGYAESNTVELPGQPVTESMKQMFYLFRMAKRTYFIALNVDADVYLPRVKEDIVRFEEAHNSLIRGVPVMSWPATRDVCVLNSMMQLFGKWTPLRTLLRTITDNSKVTRAELLSIVSATAELETKVKAAARFYRNVWDNQDSGCIDDIQEDNGMAWRTTLSKVGYAKYLGEKVARLFFQKDMKAKMTADLTATLTETSDTLRMIIEGSTAQGVASPPTQEIANDLLDAWRKYSEMETLANAYMASEDKVAPVDMSKMLTARSDLTKFISDAETKYLAVTVVAQPSVRAFTILTAFAQMYRMEKIATDALLIALGNDPVNNGFARGNTSENFKTTHETLLTGNGVSEGAGQVPKTEEACTLQKMLEVLELFQKIDDETQELIRSDLTNAEAVSSAGVLGDNIAGATPKMEIVVGEYVTPPQCTSTAGPPRMSTAVWEVGMTAAVTPPEYYQAVQLNFFLQASELSAIWAKQTTAALAEHMANIAKDAESPTVAAALAAFTASWTNYSTTDEQRKISLRRKYVNDNPYPVGSKDNLMYAEGNERYHADHKTYHPIYRDLASARSYQDVFLFDLNGNLVYSVFKEKDFATNFAADGEGDYKTSLLGQVYEAAKASPDSVLKTSWGPYAAEDGAVCSFLATAVKDNTTNKVIGVLATQMPTDAKPIDAESMLTDNIHKLEETMGDLKFGKSAALTILEVDIPPAPNQVIANKLFAVDKDWVDDVKPLVTGSTSDKLNQAAVLNAESALEKLMNDMINVYIEYTFNNAALVQGKKIAVASEQKVLISKMVKEAVLLGMEHPLASATKLKELIEKFEENHQLLVLGDVAASAARRLNADNDLTRADEIPPSEDSQILATLGAVETAFTTLKAKLLAMANADNTASGEEDMRAILEDMDSVNTQSTAAYEWLSTRTRSTTTVSIDIMAPMPLTGDWTGGRTMRIAALVAQGLMNEAQNVLPGFSINTHIFDDKCDSQTSVEIVLAQKASHPDRYIGVGGSGCSDVCAGTAFVASSMMLPYVSYECADASLSDTEMYTGFVRFGTVTSPMTLAMREMGTMFSWSHITIISGDPTKYRTKAEDLESELIQLNFQTDYVFSYDTEWDEIVAMMDNLRISKRRVFFVMGTETYFRKLLCASLVVQANTGITWMSEGTWRHDWHKKGDVIVQQYKQFTMDGAASTEIRTAASDLKEAFDAFAPTAGERLTGLQQAYQANKDSGTGDEAYHTVHNALQTALRNEATTRNYEDVFIFDTEGNCIYSLEKELDFAENFQTGTYQASGLGDAFKAALADPDTVHEISWAPYAARNGAEASFLSTGIKDSDMQVIGYYVIMLPDSAKSIETVDERCTLEAIANAYDGAINFAGLGQPVPDKMDESLDCFPGYTATTLETLVDAHFADGYGVPTYVVADPYNDVKMHTMDGTCLFAYAVRKLLDTFGGAYTMAEIRQPDQALYQDFLKYIKTQANFEGASGTVKFQGNDRPNFVGLSQITEGTMELKGIVNDSVDFSVAGGPSNESWKPANPDPPPPPDSFPYFAFQILIPVLCVCCPAIAGCIRSA